MLDYEALDALLQSDLTRARVLSPQVLNYIDGHYSPKDLTAFFHQTLPGLEAYEVDLVLSPLFTPSLQDRLPYMALLGADALSPEALEARMTRLSDDSNLSTPLLGADGQRFDVPLHGVSVERYVHRLGLERPLPSGVFEALSQWVPADHQAWVNALGRDPVWQTAPRSALLVTLLEKLSPQGTAPDYVAKIQAVTDWVRTYRPTDLPDLARHLRSLVKSYELDLQGVQNRGFHDAALKEQYVEAGVSRNTDSVAQSYQQGMALAQSVLDDIAGVAAL